MYVCSQCLAEVENEGEHLCESRARGQAPYLVLSGQNEFEIEETVDMKFHVEKQEDPMIGAEIGGRYRILSLLGRGGMGVVYKGEQTNIDRTVAIKMLHPHLIAEADALKRFKAEAQAISRVDHPHSVRIYDFGITEHGQPYLVMDYLDGISLRESLRTNGTLNIKRSVDIFEQVMSALGCAHQVGVVHRDLKPENIMLGERSNKSDWVSVVDFGISGLASAQTRFDGFQKASDTMRGSPPYMSPEQCTPGMVVDNRSDIYSLAIVIFESLTGRLPYSARNASSMLEAHRSATPMPLKAASESFAVCDALTAVLAKALEKQPDKRYVLIDDFRDDFVEAAKKDNIRLNFLVNRKDLTSGDQSRIPATIDSDGAQTLADPVHAIKPPTDARPKFSHCPRCNEPLHSEAAFCLACGRSLAAAQEFAKIRAASGVFTLPKSQQSQESSTPNLLALSIKTRAVTSEKYSLKTKALIGFAIVMFLATCWFGYRIISASQASTAASSRTEEKP